MNAPTAIIAFTVPTTAVELEPEFAGPGTTISISVPIANIWDTIAELRKVADGLRNLAWTTPREVSR